MKKGYLILIVILFVISLIVYFDDTLNNEKGKVCYEENCFDVEIVDSDIDRAEGLMFRESLCDDCGMLFIFDENGRYPFWMKNTLIYLDIIWIDENKEIVFITEKAEPYQYHYPQSQHQNNFLHNTPYLSHYSMYHQNKQLN